MNFDDHRSLQANTDGSGESSVAAADPVDEGVAQDAIVPVVLSGGGGSRLWPFSTTETPKQFLPLVGERTLFQEALARVRDRLRFAAPVVVGSLRHAELCERELELEAGEARLILEPCARNTAPAIAMAACEIRASHGDDALMLVMPSDHVIEKVDASTRPLLVRRGPLALGTW